MRPLHLGEVLVPPAAVVDRVAAELRRQRRVGELERVAAHDPHPRRAVREQRRERADVVLDDHVRLGAVEDGLQLRLAVDRPVQQRRPDGLDERGELLDRGLAELRRRLHDEVGPELAGVLLALGRRREVDEILLEAERFQAALPRRFGGEHDAVPALLEHLADPDAVVRRPVGALGHEDDRPALVRHRLGTSCGDGPRSLAEDAPPPRDAAARRPVAPTGRRGTPTRPSRPGSASRGSRPAATGSRWSRSGRRRSDRAGASPGHVPWTIPPLTPPPSISTTWP